MGLFIVGYAGHSQAETLEQAVLSALNNHPSIEQSEALKDISGQDRREAFSKYFPELSIRASTGRVYGDNSTSRGLTVTRGAAYSNTWDGSATLSQMLYDGLETPNRVAAADARIKASELSLSDAKETLAMRSVSAYLNVMRTREALDLLQSYTPELQNYKNRISGMVDKGAVDRSELSQAQNVELQFQDIVVGYLGDYENAVADYIEATGALPADEFVLPTPNLALIPDSLEAAVNQARESHPLLTSLQYEERAAEYDVDATRGTLMPDLGGELSYYEKEQREEIGGEIVDAKALVRLNWDFSTGGAQLARVKKAKYQRSEARAKKEAQQLQIERGVKVAYNNLSVATKKLELSKQRLEASRNLYETQKKQFDAAKISQLQLMQTENALVNAKLYYINSKFRNLVAQYQLLSNIGRIQDSIVATADLPKRS